MMMVICQTCSKQFGIDDTDQQFYQRIAAPLPRLCPACRLQRRLAFRNERSLFSDHCAKCRQPMISLYNPTAQLTVYCPSCWWKDDWDPSDFGQDIDWQRSLLQQYLAVRKRVPRLALINLNSENSEYTNMSADNKDCYLLFASENNENCSYGKLVQSCKDCFDNCFIYNSELLYQCINVRNCYRSIYLQDCQDSRDCGYSIDLKGCSNVWLSSNLQHKQYYIRNQPVKPEDYPKLVAALQHCEDEWRALNNGRIVKSTNLLNSAGCTGDNLTNCKRVYDSYDITGGQDLRYCTDALDLKDSYDCSFFYYQPELCYNSLGMLQTYNVQYSSFVFYSRDIQYSEQVHNSHDVLLSSCVRNKQYMILNKQYAPDEYQVLKKKIIEQLQADGEYGELPPLEHSLFAYTDTVAQEYFPREVANTTAKPFKLTKAEQAFYELMHLPAPTEHPDRRHHRRMAYRNPRMLWQRPCQRCAKQCATTYAPDRTEQIYCEKCYQQAIY